MLFYDFEVFRYDWLVVILDEKLEETVIINDKAALEDFFRQHQQDLWIGYNNRSYDQWILRAILCGFSAWEMNDWIINKGKKGWEFSDVLRRFSFYNYDCFNGFHGLKTLEAFMGHDIRETQVSFNIDRKLTPEEIASTVTYCRHDVKETIEVFLRRKDDYKAHMELLKSFNLPMNLVSKTKAQLIARILEADPKARDDEFNLRLPDTLILGKYQYVKDWYLNPENRNYEKKLETVISGVEHTFAWGGVHGAKSRYSRTGRFFMIDVASLYPSLMIRYGYLSRNVKEAGRYKEIYETNLEMKKSKDPRRPAYKLVCNTTYGCMKDPFNPLYDPLQANNVCVAGQLLLLDLMEKIEGFCELVQSNTDGLLVRVNGDLEECLLRATVKEWEDRTGLRMEYTEFSKVYQKDVNNYLAVTPEGKVKSKGAYVKALNPLDNDLAIVNTALREYMINKVPIRTTIERCSNLIEFQKVVHISSKYSYGTWNGNRLNDRTFRVFAAKKNGGLICKVKTEGGTQEKFANTPERCFIINEDVTDAPIPENLDKEWYIRLAMSRLKEFLP